MIRLDDDVTVSIHVAAAKSAVAHLDDAAALDDAELLGWILFDVRDLLRDLRVIQDSLTRRYVEIAARTQTIEGRGTVEWKRGLKRSGWQWGSLVPAVVSRVIEEPGVVCDAETGEVHPPHEIGSRIAGALQAAFGFSYGRVGELRALGLDPGEYCREEADAPSVILRDAG